MLWLLVVLFLAAAGSAAGSKELTLVVVFMVVGYFISLRLHPYTRCRVCTHTPRRHHGAIFNYAYRPCRACGGSGRKDRLGVRVLSSRSRGVR